MNKNILLGIGVVVAIALSLFGLVRDNQSVPLGASGTRFPNGLSTDTTSPTAGQIRGTTFTLTGDAVLGGGNGALTLTTSNSATSTAIVGCIQTYATSTATAIRQVYSTIATTSPTTAGSNTIGLVGWQYGTCPN